MLLGDDGLDRSKTEMAALFFTERSMVQPVAMSLTVKVKQNPSFESSPSWPTRSISTNQGTLSSQSAQVRTGIRDLSSVSGLVCERPRSPSTAGSGARRRSMVAALMATSRTASSSLGTMSPSRRNSGTTVASIGARRLPEGPRVGVQQRTRQPITQAP